jgi:NDP-sugar pyrophosphorylase family protein
MDFRELTQAEISLLEKQNCHSQTWNDVKVKNDFSPTYIFNSSFEGKVFIGENVRIKNSNIKNYRIEDDCIIDNVYSLSVEGESTFGNGISISVLNEGGGRELLIYDKLSSQIAYLIVTCRHDDILISKLNEMIEKYSESKKSDIGLIERGSSIRNCGLIKNVAIGEYSKIEGASKLTDGTIRSSKSDPVFIGSNVIANHFIIQSGSSISDGAVIENSFIGQGVKIGKQYSMENSAFFCNSEGFHGEAVSVFAGPYTVTHHKSTLLIAAMFSFYNAGSGSNQSNHMYKLGPIHQGILERGSKTGSFSYMIWPSRVGAFSVVIGKHYNNFDASEFPFSYLNEENGKTLLTPAMNLFTVGTKRDSEKWPARDRRKDEEKFDIVNFELFNPYIVIKVLSGITTLSTLLEKARKEQEFVSYKGLAIKRLLIKTCIKYYEMIIKIFIGEQFIKRLELSSDFKSALSYDSDLYSDNWIDAAGMFISKKDYDKIQELIKSDSISDLDMLLEEFNKVNETYSEAAWCWTAKLIEERFKVKITDLSKEHLTQIISDWKENRIKLNNMTLKDAEKEFDQFSKIGFGIDGDSETQEKDFVNVRGKFDENKFVIGLKKDSESVSKKADEIIKKLNSFEMN